CVRVLRAVSDRERDIVGACLSIVRGPGEYARNIAHTRYRGEACPVGAVVARQSQVLKGKVRVCSVYLKRQRWSCSDALSSGRFQGWRVLLWRRLGLLEREKASPSV